MIEISVGDIFNTNFNGELKVIKVGYYASDITVKFVRTGYIKKTSAKMIRSGDVYDPFSPRASGIGYMGRERGSKIANRKARSVWNSMLKLSVKNRFRVSHEWLNFSNFEKWFEQNSTKDRQILVKNVNATIYCNYTVRVTTKAEANAEISRHRMRKFKLVNSITGDTYKGENANKASRSLGLGYGAVSRIIRGAEIDGWKALEDIVDH